MNILYISKLKGNMWAGLNHSVPAQVKSQSKLDNCFWYNLNHVKLEEWSKDGLDCKNLDDYPSGRLSDLPEPFNKPDLAIFESCYCFTFERIVSDLKKDNIPYVIVPRSSLTKKAQNHKPIKKRIGNYLFYNNMIRSATGIHYLSDQERIESIEQWGDKGFVIPNGTHFVERTKDSFNTDKIDAIYIGRIDIYQKGLDLLIEAISEVKDQLRHADFHLSIYGPNRNGAYDILLQQIKQKDVEDLVSLSGPLFGKEKENRLLSSDLFVMASRFEGMPMGLIEALSYGLPAIVTVGTNMYSFVCESDSGWGADNNVQSIKEALISAVNDKSSFKNKSNNAVICSQQFNWDRIAESTHIVFEELLKESE